MSEILALRQALCLLLSLIDHRSSRELARLGICIADIYLEAMA
jgi:hypothetical protein